MHHASNRVRLALGALALLATVGSRAQAQHGLGLDTLNFDRTVRPQDDFFRYVNGGWIKRAEIPADASSYGAFVELRDKSRDALHSILDETAAGKVPGVEARKIGDLYASYMDSARVERLGTAPLAGELRMIKSMKSTAELPSMFAHLARMGVGGAVGVGVAQDPKASSVNILQVRQSGLGMPDRDYYLRTDAKMAATRAAYVQYVARLLTAAKVTDASGAANRILALETQFANKQWDRARSRDRNATYNKMTVGELAQLTPHYSWNRYLSAAGLGKATDVVVGQPDFVKAFDSIVVATPVSTWREWMTYKLLDSYARELPAEFAQARFEFRNKTLSGQQEMSARWKRGYDEVEGVLGEPAGKLYVARNFKPAAKARMDSLVRNLREAYRVGIDSLEWMSPTTKAQAKDKLAHFTVKIGYNDHPRDYSGLAVKRGDLFGNAVRANEFQYQDMISRLGKPVDRTRWGMTPQTVNAYYNPSNNEIVFPAAILQPPFFDVTADDAVNYGAIGAVIGHEIGHGFDDQGRKSDGEGNLRDWWTSDDAKAFDARTKALGEQYGAIIAIDDIHINPGLTMGENIGDLSGLAQAYRAYRMSLHGQEAPVIGGFTGDQRFFMGFAQIWRTKFRDEALRSQLLSDPHSPGMYRAFVPLVNNDAFQRAFDVKPGDRMYRAPADRVRIW